MITHAGYQSISDTAPRVLLLGQGWEMIRGALAAASDTGAIELIGPEATRDAILVAAGFNGITRVADAIGIRLDSRTANASVGLRATIGIDAFAPAEKWIA